MEAVFKEFPNVDVIWVKGEDYYLNEPKHLGSEEVKAVFRDEKVEAKFKALQGIENDKDARIVELSLEVEDLKAELAEYKENFSVSFEQTTQAIVQRDEALALIEDLKAENEKLKAEISKKSK